MLLTKSKKAQKTETLRSSRKTSKKTRRCSECGFRIRGIDHVLGDHHKSQEKKE